MAVTAKMNPTGYSRNTNGTLAELDELSIYACKLHELDANGAVWTEERLVALISADPGLEFVDYGYIKITKWLQCKHKLLINKKKVYRLMSKHWLLNSRSVRGKIRKQWIKELVPNPVRPLTHLVFDIKYLHIHGSRSNAILLTVLDVKSRFDVGWLMQWRTKKEDVVAIFNDILLNMPTVSKIAVRSDNGSQFVSHLVRE